MVVERVSGYELDQHPSTIHQVVGQNLLKQNLQPSLHKTGEREYTMFYPVIRVKDETDYWVRSPRLIYRNSFSYTGSSHPPYLNFFPSVKKNGI